MRLSLRLCGPIVNLIFLAVSVSWRLIRRLHLRSAAARDEHVFDRVHDRLVARAAAVVARQVLADLSRVAAGRCARDPARRSACRACRSRTAGHCAGGMPPAARPARPSRTVPRWSRPACRPPAPRASGSRARSCRRPAACTRRRPRARNRCAIR
jgi:hypothetical protein